MITVPFIHPKDVEAGICHPRKAQNKASFAGHAIILMGKNTMIRKAIRGHLQRNPALEKLLPYIVRNVGFVFTKEDLGEIREKLLENRKVCSIYA